MSEQSNESHLPECRYVVFQQQGQIPEAVIPMACICSALRACEQRVRMEDDDYAYVAVQAEADGRIRGWNKALYAAQEAIRNREDGEHFPWVQVEIALAAIDSLRGES